MVLAAICPTAGSRGTAMAALKTVLSLLESVSTGGPGRTSGDG